MSMTYAHAVRRDRWLVFAGMAFISLLSWAYMLRMVAAGEAHQGHQHELASSLSHTTWDGSLLLLSVLMWSVMMVAMMVPTATPMLLSFNRLQHRRDNEWTAAARIGLFISGYLVAWTLFSLLAAVLQWSLHGLGLMSSAMGRATPELGGLFLLMAGLFQWSNLKEACLSRCRSPLQFLLDEWRPGGAGALIMGLRHGVFCIGCCWLLMLLMFAGGVMNLLWMAALTLYMLAEKALPGMRVFSRLTGAALAAGGTLLLAGALVG